MRLAAAAFVGVLVGGCVDTVEKVKGVYCDKDQDCAEGQKCYLQYHSCVPNDLGIPGDMNMCMASACNSDLGNDMAMCTSACGDAGADLGRDMEHPDLMPQCVLATDCTTAAEPICGVDGNCRGCTSSSDNTQCAAHSNGKSLCDTTTQQCVQCNTSPDCSGTTPVCDTNVCRACKADSECASSICEFSTGGCVPSAMIALVDHGGVGVATCTTNRGGTQNGNDSAHAWCDVPLAITSDTRNYLLVTGHGGGAQAYTAILTIPRDLTIVGPGGVVAAGSRATIDGSAVKPAVTIDNVHTVMLDGLELTAGASGNQGINCSQAGATLIVRNSSIDNNNGVGIASSGCTLKLDGDFVGPSNVGGGLSMSGGTSYTITNTIIYNNGSGAPGVAIADSASTGTFSFNTIGGNGGAGAFEGGINCPSAGSNKIIQNSIVANNSHNPMLPTAGATQFSGKCQLQNVVTGTDAFANATPSPAAFTADYHLDVTPGAALTTNQACCINKIGNVTGLPNTDHDVDFGARPKGPSPSPYDIGAHEAQ